MTHLTSAQVETLRKVEALLRELADQGEVDHVALSLTRSKDGEELWFAWTLGKSSAHWRNLPGAAEQMLEQLAAYKETS